MKLASCILAFSEGISVSNRPEDRVLVSQYLSALAPLLAKAVARKEVAGDIEAIDRLFGHTWIADDTPFKEAFRLWEQSKVELKK
jgi:hypothetical protein